LDEIVNHCKQLSDVKRELKLALPDHLAQAVKDDNISLETIGLLEFHFTQWELVLETLIQKQCDFTSDLQYIIQEMSFWDALVKEINAIKAQITACPVYNVVRLLRTHCDLTHWNKLLIQLDERLSEGTASGVLLYFRHPFFVFSPSDA
jgi:hypothetical protein